MPVPTEDETESAPARQINGGCLLIAFLGLPIIAVTLFGYRMFFATEVSAEVLGHRWERIVTVETLTTHSETSSCDTLPLGAYDVVQRPATGGASECDYKLNRWEITATKRSDGDALEPAPSWPEVNVTGCEKPGCTRLGPRDGRYFLELLDSEGDRHKCRLQQKDWETLQPGEQARGKKSIFLDAVACRSFLD